MRHRADIDLATEKAHREAGETIETRCNILEVSATRYKKELVAAYGPEWWADCSKRACVRSKAAHDAKPRKKKMLSARQVRLAKEDLEDRTISLSQAARRLKVTEERIIEEVGADWWSRRNKTRGGDFTRAVAYSGTSFVGQS